MNTFKNNDLFFWHFFHQIEKELSYERWIDKYKMFIQTLANGQVAYEEDFASFRRFCKILYLQDIQHEKRFDELLNAAIEKEKVELIKRLEISIKEEKEAENKKKKEEDDDKKSTIPVASTTTPSQKSSPFVEEKEGPKIKEEDTVIKYFHPKIKQKVNEETEKIAAKGRKDQYLHTDEYFPVTRRDMVKTWQYLRRSEKTGWSKELDINATIKKVARDGLFTEPVYQKGAGNRKDTLMIFADVRGSMMPFHDLSDRMIKTVKEEGGHPNAPIYYFQDYPRSYLFEQKNLTNPIPVKTVFQKGNKQSTIAFIISDAGAARGGMDEERVQNRYKNTMNFVSYLRQTVAHIIWINPFPKHRWQGTAAALLAPEVSTMIPVLEEEDYDFQNTIRLILKAR